MNVLTGPPSHSALACACGCATLRGVNGLAFGEGPTWLPPSAPVWSHAHELCKGPDEFVVRHGLKLPACVSCGLPVPRSMVICSTGRCGYCHRRECPKDEAPRAVNG